MKKPIRVNERGIRIGESHPNARLKDTEVEELRCDRDRGLSLGQLALKWGLSKSGVKAICDGRSRGQIGPTVDKAQTVPVKQQYVRVKLSVPLSVRAKLHRLGGSSWLIKRVTEGRERHVLPEIGFVTESAVLEHYPVTRDKWHSWWQECAFSGGGGERSPDAGLSGSS